MSWELTRIKSTEAFPATEPVQPVQAYQKLVIGQRTAGESDIITIRKPTGVPYDLTGFTVDFIAKELWTDQIPTLHKPATVVEAGMGQVKLTYTEKDTAKAGVWVAQFTVKDGDTRKFNSPLYLEVTPSLDVDVMPHRSGAPTISEIRLAVMDTCSEDNYLLDDTQFKDHEIVWAIRRPVEEWNETPPSTCQYTTRTFPFRYHWLKAIVAELLMIKVHNYMRNNARYSVSGGQISDKDKGPEYIQLAAELRKEWSEWMIREKVQQNIAQGWGVIVNRGYYRPFQVS